MYKIFKKSGLNIAYWITQTFELLQHFLFQSNIGCRMPGHFVYIGNSLDSFSVIILERMMKRHHYSVKQHCGTLWHNHLQNNER